MAKLDLKIEGMHCGACSTGIQMVLSNLTGVKSVHVDYEGKKGEVEFDEGKIKKDEIFKAVQELGYKVS